MVTFAAWSSPWRISSRAMASEAAARCFRPPPPAASDVSSTILAAHASICSGSFPLIMTASHMIFGFGAFSPLMLMSEKYYSQHTRVLTEDWKGLATIAVMNGVQIACNNASLTVMELSMNQVIRASIPVLVALIAVCVEHKIPSKSEIACLFGISLGVMLAVWEESRNAVLGIILTVSERAILRRAIRRGAQFPAQFG